MNIGRDIGIDLGTASVYVYVRDKGIVLSEPSVVTIDRDTGKVLKVGAEAQATLGRTPGGIVTIRPLRQGVISDYDMTEQMLRHFLRKVGGSSPVIKPRMLVGVPSGITEVQERAVIDAGIQAGARRVWLIEEPMAAAIGAGLEVAKPVGNMVVDIGGGTADVAVISLSGIVISESVKVAGDDFNDAAVRYMRKVHNLLIGEQMAEQLKIAVGCVVPPLEELRMDVAGRSIMTGLPETVSVCSSEMTEAFAEPAEKILEVVLRVLEQTPPELVADISDNGIIMTGGGSLMRGLAKLITGRTGIPAFVANDCVECVARGIGKSLSSLGDMQDGTMNLSRRKQIN